MDVANENQSDAGDSVILFIQKHQQLTGWANLHSVWTAMSVSGSTPRPASETKFRGTLFALIGRHMLEVRGGSVIETPLTKLIAHVEEPPANA